MLEDAESTMASSLGKEMRLTNPSNTVFFTYLTDQIEFIENIFPLCRICQIKQGTFSFTEVNKLMHLSIRPSYKCT